ncbi:MAG: hypothetical protein ACI4N3_00410 [Alphaproteobacteria bacterium]
MTQKLKLDKRGGVLLVLNGIVYLALYYIIVYKNSSSVPYFLQYGSSPTYLDKPVYFFLFLIFLSIIRGYNFLKTRKLSFYDSFLLASDGFVIGMYFILNLKVTHYYYISYILLGIFLIYYLSICSKYIKYFITVTMILHIIANANFCFDFYKLHYKFEKTKRQTYIKELKDRDIIVFNSYHYFLINDYFRYVINENKNIINFEYYTNEEIIDNIKNLPVKEYIIIVSLYDLEYKIAHIFNKIKYNLSDIENGYNVIWNNNTYLLTPIN